MRPKLLIVFVGLALAVLAIAGCVAAPRNASPIPPTKTPKPTFTPTPAVTPTPIPIVTPTRPTAPTAVPTATLEPSPTAVPPTPTPAAPKLTANQNVNVRSGPGTNYTLIGALSAGQSFEIIGKNPTGDWYQFDFNGRTGWVRQDFVTVSGDSGAIKVAQNIPPPPPTVPPPTPTPVPPTAPPPPPAPVYPFSLLKGVERCDPNIGNTYFNGFVRNRDNSPLNGVCVHIAFYGPRQTKCSGCGGVGDGVWGFSPFGGPAPRGVTVEIFVVSCDGVPEGGQDQRTGFGNLTPLSDKWVRTINDSEQCTGITFVKN